MYQAFLSVPFGNFFTGTDYDNATEFPQGIIRRAPTKENEVRDSHHEPNQGVSQHSRFWIGIVVALVFVVALATILVIKQRKHQKKTKGK